MKFAKATALVIGTAVLALSLTACKDKQPIAMPTPTGTSAYYVSLKGANLVGTDYMSPEASVHLGQLVCENLAAGKNAMWIIKNIVTLNGDSTPPEFTPEDRSKFALGVIASAVTHLCPEQKGQVLPSPIQN